jgi:hypothetical protein
MSQTYIIPATRKPTFDVNDTRLQTYPWVDAANNPVTPGLTGPGRLNYLCYLETVGTNTPPALSDKNVILSPFVNGARRGNWTDGVDPKQDAPTKFGNFVLSSTCFLEGYFLPKLENLNRLMRLDLDSSTATLPPNSPAGTPRQNIRWLLGENITGKMCLPVRTSSSNDPSLVLVMTGTVKPKTGTKTGQRVFPEEHWSMAGPGSTGMRRTRQTDTNT